ncbi:hypothetical protein [uncultured Phascolarctobacterium sp.]|uniref:hypothetical protein n=3 Tax=Phascolarctobacterium TaxID=33024 RepID=UPI0025F0D35F|nr:hypothetical protein [uncultured Phascolarctobacterium sp.]
MGKGKKVGKIAFMAAGFFLGAGGAGQAFFNTTKSFVAGMYGMSLASTIWSVIAKPDPFGNLDGDYSQDDYSKFSTTTNDISQDAVIPVIYGTRKWGGLQVWHNPYNGERYLQKDVGSYDQQAALLSTVIETVRNVYHKLKELGPIQYRTQFFFAV